MDQNKTVEIFNANATLYQLKNKDLSRYSEWLDYFCENLPKLATILDIACGTGNIAAYMLGKNSQLKWHGIDLAANIIAIAKQNNPNALFEIKDGTAITTINKKFDGVVCSFYLPYINFKEAEILIFDISQILNINGLIYLSANEAVENKMEIVTNSLGDKLAMHYYSETFLTNLLEKNNFTLLKKINVKYKNENQEIVEEIVLVAKK